MITPQRYAILSLFVILISQTVLAGEADTALVEAGKRIFREGVLPNGEALRAQMQGDLVFSGAQAACISCHRRSGLGSVEGGRNVLPVTGTALYQPGPAGLWQKFNFKTKGNDEFRPAYTDASLSKAIREGVTPTGRKLRQPMPKFNLGDADIQALIAYLKTLSNAPSVAVDKTTMHLATVITPDAEPGQRKAMLDVIDAFFKDKNTETRSETRRRQTSKEAMYTSYRTLDMQIWQLTGPADTWASQLQEKYKQQPVFALISGLAGQQWQPVHDFCQQMEVACLFPNTDVVTAKPGDFHALYLSRGLLLDAEVLGKQLAQQAGSVMQVFRDTPKGNLAAAQLQQTLQAAGQAAPMQRKLAEGEKPDAAFWAELVKNQQPASLVLWLEREDLAGLETLAPTSANIYVSASLVGEQLPPALQSLRQQLRLLASWDTPEQRKPRVARTRVWMQTRQVAFTHEILQANTFWSLLTVSDAIKHLAGNFSSDYLLERIGDMTESTGVLSIYPRLSLGPGQQFAAKSARLLQFDADGSLKPAGEWINP